MQAFYHCFKSAAVLSLLLQFQQISMFSCLLEGTVSRMLIRTVLSERASAHQSFQFDTNTDRFEKRGRCVKDRLVLRQPLINPGFPADKA